MDREKRVGTSVETFQRRETWRERLETELDARGWHGTRPPSPALVTHLLRQTIRCTPNLRLDKAHIHLSGLPASSRWQPRASFPLTKGREVSGSQISEIAGGWPRWGGLSKTSRKSALWCVYLKGSYSLSRYMSAGTTCPPSHLPPSAFINSRSRCVSLCNGDSSPVNAPSTWTSRGPRLERVGELSKPLFAGSLNEWIWV